MFHRLSATNYYLNKCGIKDFPLCSYCNQLPETLEHLFSECAQIKKLWIDIENWLKSIRVRIDRPHPLVCRKRRLNGAVLRMRPEKPRPRVTAGVAR
jgi:hypothetical protein